MNDTTVTVVGNVVDSPRRVSLENGAVTNFRMASTARRYDSATQQYVDSGTLWVDVECWGSLSGNVAASISKGDPVIVQGALTTHSWESESGPRSKPRIRAFAVGPNLSRGTADFKRDRSGRTAENVDRTTGEITPQAGEPQDDPFTSASAEPRPGRDYDGDGAALEGMDAAESSLVPAHA
ncbi:single-stranded DNA-binding protein [Blastococcus sp. TF02-09]|uniref:single-stranded DNA-binding protein n=1 Tax=Blastococcus sp. TF02-09 TaxID=2250576 RepID=UPI000DEB860A|nr:single-stranded DNA-binding protein [Blastococcus sp. TF02-9]RBY78441.1 single-stranded DNA-binding protein [Blastococcus sp. TF02-9]